MDSLHTTRISHDRDYDRRERGRSMERGTQPDRSTGETQQGSHLIESAARSPPPSDHMLDRHYSSTGSYRSEPTLDRTNNSPDPRHRQDTATADSGYRLRDLEPLEKPLNVLLLKNRLNEDISEIESYPLPTPRTTGGGPPLTLSSHSSNERLQRSLNKSFFVNSSAA
ncbi:tight junction protein ZO-2 [Lates japonicus]|uniref:Tight junction protein ZO-2 n=1 Tax=Lates japonicus TaxID=270547 RepID=A0AAD3R6F9_LATJO|nr:tight junction protein ZO-2 [Lates japonicus]